MGTSPAINSDEARNNSVTTCSSQKLGRENSKPPEFVLVLICLRSGKSLIMAFSSREVETAFDRSSFEASLKTISLSLVVEKGNHSTPSFPSIEHGRANDLDPSSVLSRSIATKLDLASPIKSLSRRPFRSLYHDRSRAQFEVEKCDCYSGLETVRSSIPVENKDGEVTSSDRCPDRIQPSINDSATNLFTDSSSSTKVGNLFSDWWSYNGCDVDGIADGNEVAAADGSP
nr:hypothetical protein Iba_chr09fCG11130 [Ipomoea batatas]